MLKPDTLFEKFNKYKFRFEENLEQSFKVTQTTDTRSKKDYINTK